MPPIGAKTGVAAHGAPIGENNGVAADGGPIGAKTGEGALKICDADGGPIGAIAGDGAGASTGATDADPEAEE